jgi:hypothetical protein
LKGGTAKPEEMAVARQWLSEHVSEVTNRTTTIKEKWEVVFSV